MNDELEGLFMLKEHKRDFNLLNINLMSSSCQRKRSDPLLDLRLIGL